MNQVWNQLNIPNIQGNGKPKYHILTSYDTTMFFVRGEGPEEDTLYYSPVYYVEKDHSPLFKVYLFIAHALGGLEGPGLTLPSVNTEWWSGRYSIDNQNQDEWSGINPRFV